MPSLSDFNKYFRTSNATALAGAIKKGLTAYIDGGKVTGTAYTPAMMELDGSTGYYNKTYTSSGNKVTFVCRFSRASFTGDTYELLTRAVGPTGDIRCQLAVYSSDYSATPALQSRALFFVQNSSGTGICSIYSDSIVCDGTPKTVFISFDGDAGTAQLVVSGDTGYTSLTAPTTGTLDSGASSNFPVGASHAGGNYFDGDIGFVGYRDAYLTNWSDFMDAAGNPKELDETTWAQWGAAPLFWNPHGYLEHNRGSAGNMTKNGTIIVGDGGCTA